MGRLEVEVERATECAGFVRLVKIVLKNICAKKKHTQHIMCEVRDERV